MTDAPFLARLKVISDIRDRGRKPQDRTYMHVYSPSQRKFLEALDLPAPERWKFLYLMYTQVWTPSQIKVILNDLLSAAENFSPDAFAI